MSTLKLEPKDIITLYYDALYSGDLPFVKVMMTSESYMMTLETFGLRLSLRDPAFKAQLKKIDENSVSLAEVERKLSDELVSRNKTPKIEVKSVSMNGANRQTIEYTEDGKLKRLYFSKQEDGWRINYYAGRKVA
jgi:spore cortex formation protein SpoVR/YcgB (stage V sporulation)